MRKTNDRYSQTMGKCLAWQAQNVYETSINYIYILKRIIPLRNHRFRREGVTGCGLSDEVCWTSGAARSTNTYKCIELPGVRLVGLRTPQSTAVSNKLAQPQAPSCKLQLLTSGNSTIQTF